MLELVANPLNVSLGDEIVRQTAARSNEQGSGEMYLGDIVAASGGSNFREGESIRGTVELASTPLIDAAETPITLPEHIETRNRKVRVKHKKRVTNETFGFSSMTILEKCLKIRKVLDYCWL